MVACNLISDFGYSSAKGNKEGRDASVYIRFNSLITESVLSKKWRQVNYTAIMSENSYLGRWLRKQLGLKFIQADTTKTYTIKLSTIIQNSGIVPYSKKSQNLFALEKVLKDMDDIIRKYDIERIYGTDRGRILLDARITIYPTRDFMIEQIYGNQQNGLLNPSKMKKTPKC